MFSYNNQILPVQFEIRVNDNDQHNSLFVVATIKEDAITSGKSANSGSPVLTSSIYTLQEIISNVKGNDVTILSNIPAQFLSDKQLDGKREGLIKKGEAIKEKAKNSNRPIDSPVNMTAERIDAEIRNNGAKFSPISAAFQNS
ncbi:MAG: hypothetical protein IK099_05025 [Clostridia bacterium]|nr:hypothetical protein [Clostridia bacterium]